MVTSQKYWNTWHPDSYTRMEFLPAGFAIVPAAYSEAEQKYSDQTSCKKSPVYRRNI